MEAPARKSLKSGIAFAAVGVILALAVPPLLASMAATMGLAAGGLLCAATVAGVIGAAVVFGGFGMLYPHVKSFLGSSSEKEQSDIAGRRVAARGYVSRQDDDVPLQEPEQFQQRLPEGQAKATFCQRLETERAQRNALDGLSI